jgi:hypothetical protein
MTGLPLHFTHIFKAIANTAFVVYPYYTAFLVDPCIALMPYS